MPPLRNRTSPSGRARGLALVAVLAGCGSTNAGLWAGAAKVALPAQVETFQDLDGNGSFDPGEPFEDLDGDGAWTPVWIAGFGSGRFALGVHDEPYARALVLMGSDTRVGIVTLDWVGLLHDDCLSIRDAAWEAGLSLDALIVQSAHNHEGPDTMGLWGRPEQALTGVNAAYMESARERIVGALAEAAATAVPVRLVAGLGQTEGLIADSRAPEVIDERVLTLGLERREEAGAVAVVVHWANHPECLGGHNRYVSSDFPGYLVDSLEEAKPGAVGIYWQGAVGGLMNPLGVTVTDAQGNPLPDDSFEKAERVGRLVATEALAALDAGRDASGDGRLNFRQRSFLVPMQNEEIMLAFMAGLLKRAIYDPDGDPMSIGELPSDRVHVQTDVTVLDLGEVQIAAVPGELYPELALVKPGGGTYFADPQDPNADLPGAPCGTPIRAVMRDTPYQIILGLANDEVGYIIPKCQWDQEPPWTFGETEAPYGEGLSVGPEMAPRLLEVLAEELRALQAK